MLCRAMVSVKEGDGEGSSLKEWNTQREILQETTILPTESAKSQEPKLLNSNGFIS